ncbi:hypothetical protein J6590_036853 [Homalodisca vitripennis]|nr:hypothetical protein J6590_036853 [Homalodisca vitripennis]
MSYVITEATVVIQVMVGDCRGRRGEEVPYNSPVNVAGSIPRSAPLSVLPTVMVLVKVKSSKEVLLYQLKDYFRTTTTGRAGGVLARTGSLSGHPSKQQPRPTLYPLHYGIYKVLRNYFVNKSDIGNCSPKLTGKRCF